VDFSDALTTMKQGGCVRRTAWGTDGLLAGCYVALVPAPDNGWENLLMVKDGAGNLWRVFSGANWDLLAQDWEIVPGDRRPDGDLPPQIAERIRQGLNDGVTLSLARDDEDLVVTAIHWHPGDANELARIIIKDVTEADMPLDLDGHHYLIRTREE
jgi:hypothetical protein